MCMDPNRVHALIVHCQEALEAKKFDLFEKRVNELGKALEGITLEGVDHDALVHSFL